MSADSADSLGEMITLSQFRENSLDQRLKNEFHSDDSMSEKACRLPPPP